MSIKVCDIVWNSDDLEKNVSLPSEVEIPKSVADRGEEAIADYLSSLTGCCYLGYVIREEKSSSAKLPKLPNCPFCNGAAKRVASKFTPDGTAPVKTKHGYVYPVSTWYGVKCKDCGIAQPKRTYLSREESDAAWIQRLGK